MNATVYLLAVSLPPSATRERLLDELVRDYRWSEYVRQHREFIDGIEAGRRNFNRAEWDAERAVFIEWDNGIKEYEAGRRLTR